MRIIITLLILPPLLWLARRSWRRFRALSGTARRHYRSYRAFAASIALILLDLAVLLKIEPSFPLALGIMGLTTAIVFGLEQLAGPK